MLLRVHILFIYLCLLALSPVLPASGSLTLCSTNVVELGDIYNYNTEVREFILVNDGMKRVSILDIVSTCPCFSGRIDKRLVEPGETAICCATLDARTVHGEFVRALWVLTDDPDNKRMLLKVKGRVQPLFTGIPDHPILLIAPDENTVFTNVLTLSATTTNYVLAPPQIQPAPADLTTDLVVLEREPERYRLTTVIKPETGGQRGVSISLPVSGPAPVDNIVIRFKTLVGATVKVSPSRLLITTLDNDIKKRFYVNTFTRDIQPDALKWEPEIEGLHIEKAVYAPVRVRNTAAGSNSSVYSANTRYICTVSVTSNALKKLYELPEPGITLLYPNHKSVKIPISTFKNNAPSPD